MDYREVYTEMHDQEYFAGGMLKRYADEVANLVTSIRPRNLLDYGCGKGYQYLKLRIHERWGGLLPYCYDIGVRQLSSRPERTFDGVICTDMMEHIEESDVPGVLDDILGFLNLEDRQKFVFFSITCVLGGKCLPDGRNVHVTVRSPDWWKEVIADAKKRFGRNKLTIAICFELEDKKVVKEAV